MPKYVDGYVIPVPKNKIDVYRKIARKAAKVWMKHGALDYIESVGDDLNLPEVRSFKDLAKTKSNETVIFAWIVYKSKAHRDKVNMKVFNDPAMGQMGPKDVPFEMKRMACGGFKVLVSGKP